MLLVISVILAVGLITGFYVIKNVIQPLNFLRDSIADLDQADLDKDFIVSTGDEIEFLANEFLLMSRKMSKSQQAQALAVEKAQDLYVQEQRRASELDVINQINHTVMASLDVENTADAVLRNLETLINYNSAELNIWDEERNALISHAVGNTTYTHSVNGYYGLDEGFTGWIYTHKKPLLVHNISEKTPISPKSPKDFSYKSYIGVPLVVDDKLLGTLELAHTQSDFYTEADSKSLNTIAYSAAIAIEHAHLFQESQQHAQAQEQLAEIAYLASTTLWLDDLLKRIMSKTVEAVGAKKGVALLFNQNNKALQIHPASRVNLKLSEIESFNISSQESVFKQTVMQTGQAYVYDKVKQDQNTLAVYDPFIKDFKIDTLLSVPLIAADANVGEIHIANKPTPFTKNDLAFLSSISVYLATAIQNTTLFETTQRNLQDLSVLYKSAADLSSTLSVTQILTNFSERIVSALPADECLIIRYDEGNQSLHLIDGYTHFEQSDLAKLLQKLDHGETGNISEYPLAEKVLFERKSLAVHTDDSHLDEIEKEILTLTDFSTVIMVPLVTRNHAWGLVGLYTKQKTTYSQEEFSLAQTLTNQAATALQNAQIFQETDEKLQLRLKELSGLQRVSQELNSTLDLYTTIRLVAEEAVRATGADFGNVSLYDPVKGVLTEHVKVGWPNDDLDEFFDKDMIEGIFGRVLKRNKPEMIDDLSLDGDYIPFPALALSKMVVPIHYADVVVGIINVDSQQLSAFTQDQLKYVQALAEQAAIAIRNAQDYQLQKEERRKASIRVNQLSKLSEISRAFRANMPLEFILEEIAFSIQETVGFNVVLLSVVRNERLYRVTGAGIPVTTLNEFRQKPLPIASVSTLLEAEFQLSESYFVPVEHSHTLKDFDLAPAQSSLVTAGTTEFAWQPGDLLITPLHDSEGHLRGLLSVDAPSDGNRPTLQQITTLEIFANQAATAIENTHLFQEVNNQATQLKASVAQEQRHIAELNILNQTGQLLSATLNIDTWMQVIYQQIAQLISTENIYIALYYQESDEVTFSLKKGKMEQNGQFEEVAIAFTRHIIQSKTSLLLAGNVVEDLISLAIPFQNQTELPSSWIGVPMISGDEVLGVISLQDYENVEAYTADNLSLLLTMASQSAIALQNIHLLDGLNKFNEELENHVQERTQDLQKALEDLRLERDRRDSLYNIARELSSNLELDRVLKEALSLIDWAIKISQGSILLLDPSTEYLIYRAGIGSEITIPQGGITTKYKKGVGLAGKVLETRQPVIVDNLLEDEAWLPQDGSTKHRSVVAVPLITNYDLCGVMMLFHTDYNYFIDDHLQLLNAAAPMIATAINNAQLYAVIAEQAEQLGDLLKTVQTEASKNEAIVAGIGDGVLVLDANDNIQLINPAALEIFGRAEDNLTSSNLEQVLYANPKNVTERLANDLYQNITSYDLSLDKALTHNTADDFRVQVEDRVVVITLSSIVLTKNSEPSRLVVLRDISREAQLDRIKTEFISTVSHELRTPLTSIKGYTDLLTNPKVGELNNRQHDFLDIIQSNAERLSNLVNDILDISRIDGGKVNLDLQTIAITPLIQTVLKDFTFEIEEKGLSLVKNIPPNLPFIYADPNRVTQILANLVSNAVKYTHPNGQLELNVQVVDNFMQFDIKDTGLGLSEADQQHVFERFFRAERDADSLVDGTGLGLSIAQMFVRLMGGSIWLESELGVGSIFSFTLPLDNAKSHSAQTNSSTTQQSIEPRIQV